MNAWEGPDGEKAFEVLKEAGLLKWEHAHDKFWLYWNINSWSIGQREESYSGDGGRPSCNARERELPCHRRVAFCILRDAARVFSADDAAWHIENNHCFWLEDDTDRTFADFDEFCIIAVLKVAREKADENV